MSHLHTKPGQHDVTVSAYIIRTDRPVPVLLLHMHKKLKKYLQFGGHVEHHEDPWKAITHEVLEESGYDMSQLVLLQPQIRLKKVTDTKLHPIPVTLLTHDFPGLDHYHSDIAFAFITSQSPANTIADGESNEIREFTVEEITNLPKDEIFDNVREISLFILESILNEWEEVDSTLY
jgi:ADP-ribose pyrophosphatase YjhB (NUDIX family)